jgi:electron transfer flavoprotein beta subunit
VQKTFCCRFAAIFRKGFSEVIKNKALMKILVCISQVPDTTTKIAFSDNNTKFNTAGVTMIINPYDEWYALVRALELKETGAASAVHLITVGKAEAEPVMRKALALGGDEAIRIDTDSNDPYVVAAQIAAYAKNENYDLVLCGKESIDYNNGITGAMLAEMLDMNYIGFATKLDISGTTATVNREIEGGEEVDTASLPLVVSCQKGMSEARIPNMRGIMAARTKPLKVVAPAEVAAVSEIVSYELPPAKTGVKMFDADNMDALVAALHSEAKVI